MPLSKEKTESLDRHAQQNDLFGTLATRLNNFIYEAEKGRVNNFDDLEQIVDELMFCQEKYDLKNKDK